MTAEELFLKYVEHVMASRIGTKVDGKAPDELLMRQVEQATGMNMKLVEGWRLAVVQAVSARAAQGKQLDWSELPELQAAVRKVVENG